MRIGRLRRCDAAGAQEYVGECGQGLAEAQAVQQQLACSLSTTKELLTQGTVKTGDKVTFRITVENTGDVPLVDVGVVDEFPASALQYDDASVAADFWDNNNGLLAWEESLDVILDAGETVSVDVTFDVVGSGGVWDNCALSYATANDEGQTDVSDEEFVCARFIVTQPTPAPGGGGGPRAFATPTSVPSEPTPVSTVAGATAVPAQPTPRVGITLPDTGSGSGSGSTGEAAGVLAVTIAIVAVATGAAWAVRRRDAR